MDPKPDGALADEAVLRARTCVYLVYMLPGSGVFPLLLYRCKPRTVNGGKDLTCCLAGLAFMFGY